MNATTNTLDAALKRVAVLNETIRAFATRVLPLRLFSTVFSDVPLQGTDEVVVRYYLLQTAASTDWNDSNGYVFRNTMTTSMKKITVNNRKLKPHLAPRHSSAAAVMAVMPVRMVGSASGAQKGECREGRTSPVRAASS